MNIIHAAIAKIEATARRVYDYADPEAELKKVETEFRTAVASHVAALEGVVRSTFAELTTKVHELEAQVAGLLGHPAVSTPPVSPPPAEPVVPMPAVTTAAVIPGATPAVVEVPATSTAPVSTFTPPAAEA